MCKVCFIVIPYALFNTLYYTVRAKVYGVIQGCCRIGWGGRRPAKCYRGTAVTGTRHQAEHKIYMNWLNCNYLIPVEYYPPYISHCVANTAEQLNRAEQLPESRLPRCLRHLVLHTKNEPISPRDWPLPSSNSNNFITINVIITVKVS